MKDQIQNSNTEYIIACYSRGRIFSEHKTLKGAKKKLNEYPCLDLDDYAIYTCSEWNLGFHVPLEHAPEHAPFILNAIACHVPLAH